MEVDNFVYEKGELVRLKNLRTGRTSETEYMKNHEHSVIACHDIFIKSNKGIVLVKRKRHPVKEVWWPIGGRFERGFLPEESLISKVKAECNLDIEKFSLELIGIANTPFNTDPFGHGRGTHTLNLVYYGEGFGRLNLDKLHESPKIISSEEYQVLKSQENLEDYVTKYMDKLIKMKKI